MDKSLEKLQSILEKSKNPIDSLKLEVELFGVFNLPESWKPTEADTIEYQHTVSFSKIHFQNGKVRRRELTEEEHKALEESKKLKKEAPKKKGQEQELTAEEVHLAERKKKYQEEMRKKREEELEKSDEEKKYFLIMEDIYKHPCITWENDSASEDFRIVKSYTQGVDKKPNEILDFEECVEDSGGLYLEFMRVPKLVEEDPKKKPVKGKTQEEVKPCAGKAWIDLRGFQVAGKDELFIRSKLEESESESIFKDTYVYLRIRVTPSITPVMSAEQFPESISSSSLPLCQDPTFNFRRQIKLSSLKIAEEYKSKFQDQQEDNSRKMAVTRQKELREGRKLDFLYDFNLSGKAELLKDKLKKSIIGVLKDTLLKKASLTGLADTDKDKLLSEVYGYLIEQMQASVEEVVKENKDSLHEDIVIPWEHAYRERELFLINAPKENIDDKLLRLANEYEVQGNVKRASQFHIERACRDRKNVSIWMEFTRFCLRNGEIALAEEYIKEILTISEGVEYLVLLGSLLLQRKRFEEAARYLHLAVEKDFYHVTANLVLSLLYKFTGKTGLEKKYSSIAKRLCMRHLGLLAPKRGSKSNYNPSLEGSYFRVETQPGEYAKNLTPDQVDDMYYFLTDYFLREKLIFLADKALEEISNKETSKSKYTLSKAQIFFWKKSYNDCVEVLKDLLKNEPKHEAAWILQGNALFFLNFHFDAEESYLKAVRSSNRGKTMISNARSSTHISDYSILLRLGAIYLKRRAWTDAKLVFSRCCDESPTSTSWTFLGLSCLYLNELNEAEEALTEGNILDEQSPVNWGALALLCAKRTEKLPGRLSQFLTCMNLSISFDLDDVFLLQSIAKEYIRIIVIGESEDFKLLLSILKIVSNVLRVQGKDVSDLRAFVSEGFNGMKDKFPAKKRKIDEICEKVVKGF